MSGMTLRQAAIHRFHVLCEAYGEAARALDTPAGRAAFVQLSAAIHAAKGSVPRRMWSLPRRVLRESTS